MNEEQYLVTEESEVVEPESTTEEAVVDTTVDPKKFQSAIAQKEHFRTKFEKADAERKALETRLNAQVQGKAPLAVEDYINISASLDGLDAREKAKLAEEHNLSGKALKDIREGEDYQLWQSAYRAKLEKDNALRPNAAQPLEDAPKTLADKLKNATLAEKEEILREQGMYKDFRPRADRVNIGVTRTR